MAAKKAGNLNKADIRRGGYLRCGLLLWEVLRPCAVCVRSVHDIAVSRLRSGYGRLRDKSVSFVAPRETQEAQPFASRLQRWRFLQADEGGLTSMDFSPHPGLLVTVPSKRPYLLFQGCLWGEKTRFLGSEPL